MDGGRTARPYLQLRACLASSHAALRQHGPYLAVLVELPHAGGVRMVGNLLGDPMLTVTIGAEVEGGFEHHPVCDPPYSLLQWRMP
jgi:hypothetical protein